MQYATLFVCSNNGPNPRHVPYVQSSVLAAAGCNGGVKCTEPVVSGFWRRRHVKHRSGAGFMRNPTLHIPVHNAPNTSLVPSFGTEKSSNQSPRHFRCPRCKFRRQSPYNGLREQEKLELCTWPFSASEPVTTPVDTSLSWAFCLAEMTWRGR